MSGTATGIDREALDGVFPFFLAVDEVLDVHDAGPRWPGIRGRNLSDVFRIVRPRLPALTLEHLLGARARVFQLRHLDSGLTYRGQVVPVDAGALLLVSPFVRSLEELAAGGFSHRDLAIHDPTVDMIMMAQTVQNSLKDARALMERLRGQQEALVEATRVAEAAREEAEDAARARHLFLASMSHEIRTPLNGVLGMAHLLEATPLDPQQRSFLSTIVESGSGLLTVINDILDYTRIDEGSMELARAPYAPRELVDHLTRMFLPAVRAKDLLWRTTVSEGVPLCVEGDRDRVRQVLINLVGNAVKFTDQGSVALRVDHVDGRLVCEVEDTGPGIAAEHLDHIFDLFTQADSSTTRAFGGTGLGLALCRRLCHAMDGDVGVTSTPGRGSTFQATFAAPSVEAPLRTEEPVVVLPREGVRVLLAEDNPVNQRVARIALERAGARVVVASNGREAVERATRETFDVVLMDCQMPEMDGFEATERIRREVGDALPIVAMTASVLPEDRARSVEVGMNGFVAKPVDFHALMRLLARHAA